MESAWGLVFIVLYCVISCRASFIYANNELYNFQKLDTTSSPAKITNYSQSIPVTPTWIGSDSLNIYICTTTSFYTASLAAELVTKVSDSGPVISQYFVDSPASSSDSVYYFSLQLESSKTSLSIVKQTGFIRQGYGWNLNSANVSIALYSANKTIFVLFTSSWNIYALPYDNNNNIPSTTVATNVQGNITNPTFPILVDSATGTVLWGGQTSYGFILYGMNLTNPNVTFVVYEMNTNSKLMISYASAGLVYGLQLDGNNTNGWLWQCQIRNCTPQMLFSVPSPAMLPFKYIEVASKLLYITTVRNAVVSLADGDLHAILSPRRIAAFTYNSQQNQYIYVTDTGLVEVTVPGGRVIPPLATRHINSNTSQFYFDQDISNYSIAYDGNFGDIYVSTGAQFGRFKLATSQVNTPLLQNITSPFALYVSESSQLVFACDRHDGTIKVAINKDSNATSLIFNAIANYSSPPSAIYYDSTTKLVYAINEEGLYSNAGNLSSMETIMIFPRAYQPYAMTVLHANSSEYYFLAADPTCLITPCLSIQKCNISSSCNPTFVASLSLASSLPSLKSALMYLESTDTLLVLVNFNTSLIKISGISGPNPSESVFCNLTNAISGSVAVTQFNTVLIPSNSGIMEYNATGQLVRTYNDSALNLGPSPSFTIDLSNGKFYYVDVVVKSILQSESYQTTSSAVTVHKLKESDVGALAVSEGVVYYQSEGSVIQVLGKSDSTLIDFSSIDFGSVPISYSFYAIGETLLVSNASAMDISKTTKGKSVHLYSASVNPTGLSVSNDMVYWMSTGTFSVNSWNSSDPSAFVQPFSLYAIGAEMVGLTYIPDPPKGKSNLHHYRTFIIVISAVGGAVLAFVAIFCIVRYRTRRNAYSVIEDSHMSAITTPPPSPAKPGFTAPSVYLPSKDTETSTTPVYQSFSQTHSGSSSPTSPSELTCSICEDRPKDTALSCGHVVCTFCAAQLKLCPFCKDAIKGRSKIYI
eukprot:Phypoly_transcript_01942.p1 GENE.Phypoly_transcript_01942~~Phypoly_transcript_01942.p1  ORF type:complete len:984 (+),score=140.98 Phypoly_transcript_01942:53-3004(+)